MFVYRIERSKYLPDILSGKGAAMCSGNRWNGLHTKMVYTSQSRSLAVLEILAHISAMDILPGDRLLVEIFIPDHLRMEELMPKKLPENWNLFPPGEQTQILGDDFVRQGKAALCKVQSSLLNGEFNYLINPLHPESSQIHVTQTETLDFSRWAKRSSV